MIFRLENDEALSRLADRFRQLQDPDASGLMVTWMDIIVEDNRRGVLAGLDKDGNPMVPVTYRPVEPTTSAKTRGAAGPFQGLDADAYGNLTSAEYRTWDGPPLAPRGVFSRVITNLVTEFDPTERLQGRWTAFGFWDEVVARDGLYKYLTVHFLGLPLGKFGPSIQRDLTGVRPEGLEKARSAAVAWMEDIIRSGGV